MRGKLMRICIDARSPGLTGILNYTKCLLNSLLRVDKSNEYIIITDPKHTGLIPPGADKIVVPSLNPIYWMVWSNTILPKLLDEKSVDVYHSFKHVTAYRLKTKNILTFHAGTMLYKFPKLYRWHDLMYWKFSYTMAARKYDRIITVCKTEKNFFKEELGFPGNKFRVTYLAPDSCFRVIQEKQTLCQAKHKYRLPDQFVLFVGKIHPSKNIEGVIEGYFRARQRGAIKHKLVVVGGKMDSFSWYFRKIHNLLRHLDIKEDVLLLGHICHDDLPSIYNLASLYLFPTYHEAFTVVPLEAMACGVPVLSSSIPEVREVTGDAAILVNPANTDEIAEAIIQILSSDHLKRSLIQKGLERSTFFSWDRCAVETLKVYEELVEN